MILIGCIEAIFRRVGGLTVNRTRSGRRVSSSARPVVACAFWYARITGMVSGATRKGRVSCSFGLVCVNSMGEDDCLWASDQMVLTIDGGKVYVVKE